LRPPRCNPFTLPKPGRGALSHALRTLLIVIAVTPFIGIPSRAMAATGPDSMAAIGDSITAGFNSHADTWQIPTSPDTGHCPTGIGPLGVQSATFGLDCPAHSWATGTGVNSIYLRIRANNPALDEVSNYAVSAAPVALLPAQAQLAARQGAELVTVLIGANDACVPFQTNGTPTPVPVFASQFRQAMNILSAAQSHARILVASIPDLYQLWQLFHTDPNAVFRWNTEALCPPLFNYATSTAPADVARRAAFRLLVAAYNLTEEEICRRTPRCQTDGGALFRTRLTPGDIATLTNTGGIDPPPCDALPICAPPPGASFPAGAIPYSTADFLHPSIAGQNRLADIVWTAWNLGKAG